LECSKFLGPYIWAKIFNSQISQLQFLEGLKTFVSFCCPTLLEKIFNFPTLKMLSPYGKNISDFSFTVFFSKTAALAQLIPKNNFQIPPLFDCNKRVLKSKSSEKEFEKGILPALVSTLTLSPSTIGWFQTTFMRRLIIEENLTGPSQCPRPNFGIGEVGQKFSAQNPLGEKGLG